MDDLIEFLRARLDEDELWATEASRRGGSPAVLGGVHWRWEDPETDEVVEPQPGLQTYVDDDRAGVSLRSTETFPATVGDLPQFALHIVDTVPSAVGGHIIRHDPARVLAEVEAKRKVVRIAEAARDFAPTFTTGFAAKLEDTLRLFAQAYREHPDFRPEWVSDLG